MEAHVYQARSERVELCKRTSNSLVSGHVQEDGCIRRGNALEAAGQLLGRTRRNRLCTPLRWCTICMQCEPSATRIIGESAGGGGTTSARSRQPVACAAQASTASCTECMHFEAAKPRRTCRKWGGSRFQSSIALVLSAR